MSVHQRGSCNALPLVFVWNGTRPGRRDVGETFVFSTRSVATPKRCDFVTGRVHIHTSHGRTSLVHVREKFTRVPPSGYFGRVARKCFSLKRRPERRRRGTRRSAPKCIPGHLPTTINRRHVVTFSRAYRVRTCRLRRCNRKRWGPRGRYTAAVGGEGF